MKEIRVEKVTLNIGAGKEQAVLEKGVKLLSQLSGVKPVKTVTQKRIAAWGLRPNLPIGCKVTIRKEEAETMIKRLLHAKEQRLSRKQFDNQGNLAFGLKEYIDIEGAKYNHEVGLMGLEACITLTRPGYRVKNRRLKKGKIPTDHRITQQEAVEFMKNKFNVNIIEEEK